MATTPAELPDTIEELRALAIFQQGAIAKHTAEHQAEAAKHEEEKVQLEQTVSEYSDEISQLREYTRLLKSQRFGPRSERSHTSQMGLFNEAESIIDEDDTQADNEASTVKLQIEPDILPSSLEIMAPERGEYASFDV